MEGQTLTARPVRGPIGVMTMFPAVRSAALMALIGVKWGIYPMPILTLVTNLFFGIGKIMREV